ncbi:MAG: serine protease [Polyangiaceae bacterium]
MRSRHALSIASLATSLSLVACGGSTPTAASPQAHVAPSAHQVFELVAPSVVAILNDDRSDKEQEIVEAEKAMGTDPHAPKHTIDVSLRKNPSPDGSGFIIDGNLIVTAAHVVQRPDRLRVTTRSGQTVDADLVHFDVVRDIAILKARTPMKDVKPIALAEHEMEIGEPVWAFGHTGRGYWELSWGMSAGIVSGNVDMFGARLVLFDAPIFPGFSGGPVVSVDANGLPRVVGIDHAILFTGMAGPFAPTGPISSAIAVSELKDVAASKPNPVQPALAAYAKAQSSKLYGDLFITDRVIVGRDENGLPSASLMGNARVIEADVKDTAIPCVAMLFGLPEGKQEVTFEVHDPSDQIVATDKRHAHVHKGQRVSFARSQMHFPAKVTGPYVVLAKYNGKEIGRSRVAIAVPGNEDDEVKLVTDSDAVEDGNPDVDVIVAEATNESPLFLQGIRSGWTERSYPRRVDFNWFARASRGWSGSDVSIGAYVLDDTGKIVGRSEGCFLPDVRPEHTWSCEGQVSEVDSPLPQKQGLYDIVFTVNDRPVSWWPMEAALKKDAASEAAFSGYAPPVDVEKDDDAPTTATPKTGAPKTAPKGGALTKPKK